MPYTDVFLYDVKAFDKQTHIRCTGQSNQLILDNLREISAVGGMSPVASLFSLWSMCHRANPAGGFPVTGQNGD